LGELQARRYAPLLLMKASPSGVFINPCADPLSVGIRPDRVNGLTHPAISMEIIMAKLIASVFLVAFVLFHSVAAFANDGRGTNACQTIDTHSGQCIVWLPIDGDGGGPGGGGGGG
jgi:hypothetical protein